MTTITTQAHPRVGLLGNPSDLYGGRVLGFTFKDFSARVTLEEAGDLEFHGSQEPLVCSVGRPFGCDVEPKSGKAGADLLAAALRRLVRAEPQLASETRGLSLRFETDIPRQVGLSGSSGIIVAALRALAEHFDLDLTSETLARLAQEAETDELDLVAGPQDRVLQAHRGLLAMDFSTPEPEVQRLDPQTLPPLLIAWDPEPGQSSGDAHAAVLKRWRNGDELIQSVMAELPQLVVQGVAALKAGDHAQFMTLVARNFELRSSVFEISSRDLDLIALGRDVGAAGKLCGSGGAVLFVHSDGAVLGRLAQAASQAGWGALVPQVVGGGHRS